MVCEEGFDRKREKYDWFLAPFLKDSYTKEGQKSIFSEISFMDDAFCEP